MDYPENWPQPSGLTAEGATLFSTAFSSAALKDDDWWNRAEEQAAELIASIQPIPSSEKRRQAIVDFVQDLIEKCFDFFVQVETFGSVPLKTYLPDGDIDLTALSVHTDLKETWAQDVVKALNVAEENADAQFRVKDVQYIQADVKIIKCLVENIVVDISFNQTGGLCTFCFLEQVDRYIGRDHLFKKSIILVKAWCYYESRLLGAHHGLISTYALETLVLYIFHVFHSSLRGPLKVLYTFLVYFSNFDWDKYCVSLWGPVPLAHITERISVDFAESPRNDRGSLLLTKEFLDRCIEDYSGVSAGLESNQGRHFSTKFLNVLDPIRDTNNLGRSVNVGSFRRIRSAFGLGARTLGEVLECSQDQINERFKSFFSCTFKSLERYRSGGRPDDPVLHGVQHPSSGAGSVNFHERLSSGYKQEKGADTRHSPRTTYIGENSRPQFQYNYSWPGQFDPRPMDTPELSNEIQNDSTMRTRATPTMADVPFSCSSGKDSGNTVNTVVSSPDIKQERFRATEPSLTQPISSNLNVTSSEGQWRQVGGKGRYTNVEGDATRVQVKGSNYYTAQENFDRCVPINRRSSEDHEHANHSLFRSPMVGEYQARAPSQDSPRWGSSRGDLAGQGSVSWSRDASDPSLSLSNLDMGRPPGPLGDFKTSSSHRNSNRKLSSGDENDMSTSGRTTASSEDSKATYSKWVPHQRVYTCPGDIAYQGNSQDSGNQNILQPLPFPKLFTPFLQLPSHIYPSQMHLPVSSAIPVPASNSSGPPSASSLHSTHHSPSSGESFPSRTNSYVAMQIPPILPPALPASSSCMVSVAPSGDGASIHIAGFSQAEEQWEHWRSPIEDQMQPLHRAPVTSSASPGRSFPMESTSLPEGYPSPFSVAPPVLSQFVPGKLKPVQGGSVRPFEIAEFPKAYGPIDENLSRLSISDERPGEASSQLEEGADYLALGTKNRENRPKSLGVKVSDGKHVKGTKGAEQLSRSQSSSDKFVRDVPRSVDGHAAELRLHRINQPRLEETSVRDTQGAVLPPFPAPPHSHQEILTTSLPSYYKSSPIQSGTLEPASTVSYQSLQVPNPQAGAVTDSASPSTLDRQVLLPISVGVPGAPSGSLHPTIIEHGSVSMSPSFRNRPMETVLMPLTVPQPMYLYYPPIFVMPTTSTDGVFRGDSVGGHHSNGSIVFGTDIQGSQLLKDARPRAIPQVGMGFTERPKGAGALISPKNKVETSNVERMSDEAGSSDLQEDILYGSSKTHKESLLRSFQYSCMGFLSPNFAARSPKGPQLWEGSGRQKNLNLHAGLNISQPLGGAGPSYPSRARVAEGTQQARGFAFHGNEDTLPKSRAGTGIYLPSPRHTYPNRERPGSGGRGGNHHGAYGQQDRNNPEDTNQPHAPRYRSIGQGQGQQNKHESRAQIMVNVQKVPVPDLGDSGRPQQQQSVEKGCLPPVSSSPSHSSEPTSTGLCIVSSNGYDAGMGTNAPPVILEHSVNDGSTGFSPELEFGSLGPVHSG